MQTYEVEIKSLLGTPERAAELREALRVLDPNTVILSRNNQLNHYFEGGELAALAEKAAPFLDDDARMRLSDIAAQAQGFSVRTRQKDDQVILVVKASVGSDTSENGIARIEFEATLPLTLDELDQVVLESGFSYQAKWSREREEYVVNGVNVCLDKNAGYGYLAEFERVVEDEAQLRDAEEEVRAIMAAAGVEELTQERLERMFAHYNAHWPEYYGTDKIFVIE